MKALRRIWSRIGGTFTGRGREQEMADELQSHIEMQTEDNLRAGMAPEEARRAAVLKFGSVESAKERYRDQRGAPILENLLWDFRHALRGMRNSPRFTALAILTLALGIGANTAILSVADAVLFRPLPYADPRRVQTMRMQSKRTGGLYTLVRKGYLDAMERRHRGFGEVGWLESGGGIVVSVNGQAESIPTCEVSPNYFQILGVQAARGRLFNAQDSKEPERVAVLTYESWTQRFGNDEAIIGRSVTLGATTVDIIGVLPRNFLFHSPFGRRAQVVRIGEPPRRSDQGVFYPIVRLAPGVTREQAQAELDVLAASVPAEDSRSAGDNPVLAEVSSVLYPFGRPIMRFLLAAAGLVLLIGCANLGNMLLARTHRREREYGVRAALGATRARLMRPLLVESAILGVAGAALAVLTTWLAFGALLRQVPKAAYGNAPVGMDIRVIGMALGLGLVGGLIFSANPAWRAAQLDALVLIRGQHFGGKARFGGPMVATQVAVAVVLVFGAVLAGRAFVSVLREPLGFAPENVATIGLWPPESDGNGRQAFYIRAIETLARRGDVVSVGAVGSPPLRGQGPDEGVSPVGSRERYGAVHVLPGYFETAGIRLIAGRFPVWNDVHTGDDVSVLSESAARALFPGRSALGGILQNGTVRRFRVIGIVADVRYSFGYETKPPAYIVPGKSTRSLTLIARVRTRDRSALGDMKRSIGALAPSKPVDAAWWSDSIADLTEYRNPRFQTLVLGSFAALALGLTGLGIYGIVAFMVAIRTHEMGIRMAIGAAPRSLIYFMVRQTFAPVALGLVIGLLGTRWLSQLAQAQLYKIETHDPVTLALAVATVVAAAFLAAYIPARHVSRIDPMVALRHE